MQDVFKCIYDRIGIDFQKRPPLLRQRPDGNSTKGNSYPEELPPPATVRCYSFEELLLKNLELWGSVAVPETFTISSTFIVGRSFALMPN